jgi:hypothetical protein
MGFFIAGTFPCESSPQNIRKSLPWHNHESPGAALIFGADFSSLSYPCRPP